MARDMNELAEDLQRQELLRELAQTINPNFALKPNNRISRLEIAGVPIATHSTPLIGIEQAIARFSAETRSRADELTVLVKEVPPQPEPSRRRAIR